MSHFVLLILLQYSLVTQQGTLESCLGVRGSTKYPPFPELQSNPFRITRF